jgi:hypothetical protein
VDDADQAGAGGEDGGGADGQQLSALSHGVLLQPMGDGGCNKR